MGLSLKHIHNNYAMYFLIEHGLFLKVISPSQSNCLPHAGTFSGKSAAESEADCEACHPGSYCPSWAQTSVDLLCPQGWFCPARSVSGYQAGTEHHQALARSFPWVKKKKKGF